MKHYPYRITEIGGKPTMICGNKKCGKDLNGGYDYDGWAKSHKFCYNCFENWKDPKPSKLIDYVKYWWYPVFQQGMVAVCFAGFISFVFVTKIDSPWKILIWIACYMGLLARMHESIKNTIDYLDENPQP